MPLADNRAAGFQMAQQVFGQAQQQMAFQDQHDLLMQKMAGIQGVEPGDIEAILSGDPKARGLAMSRIVQKPNGLEAIQTVSQYIQAQSQMDKQKNLTMAGGPLQGLIENIAQGKPLTPEQEAMQVPVDMTPGLMSLRGQVVSAGSREDVANLRAKVEGQGQQIDVWKAIGDLQEKYASRIGGGAEKTSAIATAAGERYGKQVMEMLGDPNWPAETDRALAATVNAFTTQAYAAADQDARAQGTTLDEQFVQQGIWKALNDLGVRPGAKEGDLKKAIAELRTRMGAPGEAVPTQVAPDIGAGAPQIGVPQIGQPTRPMQTIGGAGFSPQAATESQAATQRGGAIVNKGALRPAPNQMSPDSAIARTEGTGTPAALKQQAMADITAKYGDGIVSTAKAGKIVVPVEMEKQMRAAGMSQADMIAFIRKIVADSQPKQK